MSRCRTLLWCLSCIKNTKVHFVLLHHYARFILRYLYFSIILQAQIWSCGVILFQNGSQPEVLKHDWLQHGNRQLIFGRMRRPRFMISEKARGHAQYKSIKHDGIPLFLTMSQLVSFVVLRRFSNNVVLAVQCDNCISAEVSGHPWGCTCLTDVIMSNDSILGDLKGRNRPFLTI